MPISNTYYASQEYLEIEHVMLRNSKQSCPDPIRTHHSSPATTTTHPGEGTHMTTKPFEWSRDTLALAISSILCAGGTSTVYGQEAGEENQVVAEEVTVTGSRIRPHAHSALHY